MLVDSDRLQLRRPFERQIDPVEQGLGVELSRLTAPADRIDDRLQLRQPMATAGAAQRDRALVTDQPAAAPGEDRWPSDKARPVLLAVAGGESSDAAVC